MQPQAYYTTLLVLVPTVYAVIHRMEIQPKPKDFYNNVSSPTA